MSWRSYLFPIVLYRGVTKRKTHVAVRELYGKTKLDLDGYPQSGPRYQRVWKKLFRRLGIGDQKMASHVLLLGLGGGDVIGILTKAHTDTKIKVVEIEGELERIAKKYFGIRTSPNMSIEILDAQKYMRENTHQYDIVIIDLYGGDTVPEFTASTRFLLDVRSALANNGIAIFNYASHSFRSSDFSLFENKLKNVFSQARPEKIWGHTFYVVNRI